MAHSTRWNNPNLAVMDMERNRLMRGARQQTNTPVLPAVSPSTVVDDAVRNLASHDNIRMALWLDEARHATTNHAENMIGEYETRRKRELSEYPHSLDKEDVETVLRRSELKTLIDVAVTNTATLIDEQMVSTMQSCSDRNRLYPTVTAVSIAVGTAAVNQNSHGMVPKMVKEKAFQSVMNQEVKSMIAVLLARSDQYMSAIAKHVATTINQEAKEVDHVKNEPKREVVPPLQPSTHPSDSDSLKDTRKSSRDSRARKNRKRRKSTSPSNSDCGSLYEDSM